MARIVGAVASSHTPTIGFALDTHEEHDAAIVPLQIGVLEFPIPSARRCFKNGSEPAQGERADVEPLITPGLSGPAVMTQNVHVRRTKVPPRPLPPPSPTSTRVVSSANVTPSPCGSRRFDRSTRAPLRHVPDVTSDAG